MAGEGRGGFVEGLAELVPGGGAGGEGDDAGRGRGGFAETDAEAAGELGSGDPLVGRALVSGWDGPPNDRR